MVLPLLLPCYALGVDGSLKHKKPPLLVDRHMQATHSSHPTTMGDFFVQGWKADFIRMWSERTGKEADALHVTGFHLLLDLPVDIVRAYFNATSRNTLYTTALNLTQQAGPFPLSTIHRGSALPAHEFNLWNCSLPIANTNAVHKQNATEPGQHQSFVVENQLKRLTADVHHLIEPNEIALLECDEHHDHGCSSSQDGYPGPAWGPNRDPLPAPLLADLKDDIQNRNRQACNKVRSRARRFPCTLDFRASWASDQDRR